MDHEVKEILSGFNSRRGHTINQMREELRDMLKSGHGDDLFLYSNELQNQYQIIMQHVRNVPAVVAKDGLTVEDCIGKKVN